MMKDERSIMANNDWALDRRSSIVWNTSNEENKAINNDLIFSMYVFIGLVVLLSLILLFLKVFLYNEPSISVSTNSPQMYRPYPYQSAQISLIKNDSDNIRELKSLGESLSMALPSISSYDSKRIKF